MQTFYFSFCIFSILADSRNQLCFVGSQWIHLYSRGVATGWTAVDMSTPLLPEVVPEIDANLVSFYMGGGELGGRSSFGE